MLPKLGSTIIYLFFQTYLIPINGILSNLNDKVSGRECNINGRVGVCTYSMLCTFAKGTHLGTCRDRFIFGSCCRLSQSPPTTNSTGFYTKLRFYSKWLFD